MQNCFLIVKGICSTEVPHTVADPHLQIKGGGDHPDPEIFRPVWSKNKGEPGPLGTSPRSTTAIDRGVFAIAMIYHVGNYSAKNIRSNLTNLYGCLLPRKDVFTYNSLD